MSMPATLELDRGHAIESPIPRASAEPVPKRKTKAQRKAKSKTAAQRKAKKADKHKSRKRSLAPVARAAMTVEEFINAHHISRDFFYELLRDGLGPDCIVLGKRRLISVEAAARWREKHEQASQQD
jgi:hypothetical protein